MMSETYVECLVKKKPSVIMSFLKILSVMLAVVFLLVGLGIWQALLIGVVIGVAAYFIYLNSDLEFEYLYLDKEITIDKVMARSKRKRIGKYEVERMEVLAPLKSHRLDEYKNRQVKTLDFSSGVECQPEVRYAMYYDGGTKIILEPSVDMIKAIKNVAPRKVFTD